MGFQQAVGRPVDVCPPGTLIDPPVTDTSSEPRELGEPGGSHVNLGQQPHDAQKAYAAAVRLAGVSGAANGGGSKGVAHGKGPHGHHKVGNAEQASTTSKGLSPSGVLVKAQQPSAAHAEGGATPVPAVGGVRDSLTVALQKVAVEYGAKKHAGALEAAIEQVLTSYGAHD